MFNYHAVSPPVSGWLEISLEQEIIDYLWKIERESKYPGTSVKNTLAGNITESRSLKDTDDYFLKNVLLDCVRNYKEEFPYTCLLYTSPSPRDRTRSRMPSSA